MKNRKNVTYVYRNLNTKDIMVDDLYQREVDPKRVARIVKDYDPCLVNCPKVSFRDSKFWVYDGQHTISAIKLATAKGNDTNVECKVYSGLTRLDEMELFVQQNGVSSPVSVNQKMRSLYNFGDKDVCGMVSAANEAGVIVDFTNAKGFNKCVAPRALMKNYLSMPREQFVDMLKTLSKAWDGTPDSFCREMINGMGLFYKTYYGKFKRTELVKSLHRSVEPIQIVREGKAYNSKINPAEVYARIILRIYNKQRSVTRLEDVL